MKISLKILNKTQHIFGEYSNNLDVAKVKLKAKIYSHKKTIEKCFEDRKDIAYAFNHFFTSDAKNNDEPTEDIWKGAKVICYFSAGSYDHNRPDHSLFHSSDKGNKMSGWNEQWIDIRSSNIKSIMAKRMDLAKSKGCDGIEPDNVDGHEDDNHTGFSFGYNDQLVYNRWLADQAHSRGLSIGLKNDAEQIPQLHSKFDWALNEECHSNGNECMEYSRFLDEHKPVFNIEYVNNEHVPSSDLHKCSSHHPSGMHTQFKTWDVTAWSHHCSGQ